MYSIWARTRFRFIAEADTFFIARRSARLDQEESSQGLDVSTAGASWFRGG